MQLGTQLQDGQPTTYFETNKITNDHDPKFYQAVMAPNLTPQVSQTINNTIQIKNHQQTINKMDEIQLTIPRIGSISYEPLRFKFIKLIRISTTSV